MEGEYPPDEFERRACRDRAGVGAIEFFDRDATLVCCAHHDHARDGFFGNGDIGKCFVVFFHHIVSRQVFFNHLGFEQQRFQRRCGLLDINQCDLINHSLDAIIMDFCKVRAYPLFERGSFADVDALAARVFKKVYARRVGEIFYALFKRYHRASLIVS